MDRELLNRLKDHSVSLTREETEVCLELFRRDAEGEQAYLEEFFHFHYFTSKHADLSRSHEEQNIRQSYIYTLIRQRNIDTATLNTLYIHSAEYYYSVHVYSECIRCLFSVLENKSSSPNALSVATSILISVLAESGLYEQCYPYMDKLRQVFAENPVQTEALFIQEMSFMQLYGFSGRLEEAERYYRKLKDEAAFPDTFGTGERAYLELLHLSIEAVARQGTEPDAGYYTQVKSVCEALTPEIAFQDSNYTVTLLPVLRYLRPYIKEDELLALYAYFKKFVYSTFDLLGLYAYLFEDAGITPAAAPALYAEYLDKLRLYYQKDRDNHSQLVETALLTQAMESEYRHKAMTDRLTGLGNRLAYTELFQHHVTAPGAPEPRLCLVMMDLDDLKKQNDRFGHRAGDQLIRGAADAMRTAFGKKAELFRYGGDEFIAMLISEKEEVEAMIRQLDEACLAWTNSAENLHGTTLSVSAGYAFVYEVTSYMNNAEHLREVCELADKRMYAEKKRRHGESD